MANKGRIETAAKRARRVRGLGTRHASYKEMQNDLRRRYAKGEEISMDEMLTIQEKFQKFPADGFKVRLRNRCMRTGRPRGYHRRFGVCRNVLREEAAKGMLPGVRKSSW